MATALLITTAEREALALLRGLASENPVDMRGLAARLKDPTAKAKHMDQMTRQSVSIPLDFLVTFSIETGHECGTARHMSMSVGTVGRIPNEHGVWLVAEILGFVGGLDQCVCWIEDLKGHGRAVNVVQPVTMVANSKEAH